MEVDLEGRGQWGEWTPGPRLVNLSFLKLDFFGERTFDHEAMRVWCREFRLNRKVPRKSTNGLDDGMRN